MRLQTVHDGDGRGIARFLRSERDRQPCADLLERTGGSAAEVAAALSNACPGWLAATEDAELVTALLEAGATARRHAFVLELDLAAASTRPSASPPVGVELVPLRHVPDGLVDVVLAAYPRGHPDFRQRRWQETLEELRDYVFGRAGWTRLPSSVVALLDGEPVGAAIINRHAVPTWPEPIAWITELFRVPDPKLRGLGGAMLDAAVTASRAHSDIAAVGLSVTAGNAARGLYESRGFREVQESWTVRLPVRSRTPGSSSPESTGQAVRPRIT